MKLLLTTIAAVVLIWYGVVIPVFSGTEAEVSEALQQSAPAPEAKPEPPTAKAPDISIYIAARDGNIEAVKQYLDGGADVNAKAGGGMTLLHFAADRGHKEIVELLITKGADVNFKHMAGQTPLDMAIGMDRTETADLLRKHGGKTKTPDISIHEAAIYGNIEAVKQHLADGADVNAKSLTGWIPLHLAVRDGHNEIAELLIAAGADVNAIDKYGETPLDAALEINDWHSSKQKTSKKETADLLRKHGGKTGEELKAEGK